MFTDIAAIHRAFAQGSLTCARLVRLYLDRIEAYDRSGPALHALIGVHPDAMRQAEELDRRYAAHKSGAADLGPLHGIPVILKDNFNTFDMATTGGSIAMRNSVPPADAYTVKKMRDAGAVILAKANLGEFARRPISFSNLGGQALNPYDLTRNPGGSSGGTGAAVAACLGAIGTGSDTGQSIRSPASANNIVGIRPTRGLVSRNGIMPNSFTQDEVGPMARTVKDAALLLDVMAGYDPADPITAFSAGRIPKSYTEGLRPNALQGARIGFCINLCGTEERHREVNSIMTKVVETMESLGASVIRFSLEEYDVLEPLVITSTYERVAAWKAYFSALGPDAPVKSLEQLVSFGNSAVQDILEEELRCGDMRDSVEYKDHLLNRDRLRQAVVSKMAKLKLDAILYPLQRILVPEIALGTQPERNGTLSNGTGFPAVTFPGGFSAPTPTAPLGIPVGVDLLGRDYSEATLLAYAYAFEQSVGRLLTPVSTPALREEP